MKFNEITLENQVTFKKNIPGRFKYFTHGHEMFIIGSAGREEEVKIVRTRGTKIKIVMQDPDNWVANLTSGDCQKLPDCIDPYNGTGTLYHDRREMKCYLVGGLNNYGDFRATCSVLDIKNKEFSEVPGNLNSPRF